MQRLRTIVGNLLSLLIGLLLLAILLEAGLRAVYFSAEPRVLVYPPVANEINGLRDSDFDLVIFYHGINDARANNYHLTL